MRLGTNERVVTSGMQLGKFRVRIGEIALVICGWSWTACLGLAWTQDEAQPVPRFPLARGNAAWQHLPRTNPPLPEWARMLVETLPKTTGSMLELDYLHRAENPLGAVWSGKLRWVVADALGCEYGRQYALADLRQAGLSDEVIHSLMHRSAADDSAEEMILKLARRLTLEAHAVSDQEMASLQTVLNAEQVVALVHTVAFANFQNRIFLGLGAQLSQPNPVPAQRYDFDRAARAEVATPPRPAWESLRNAIGAGAPLGNAEWTERTIDELESALASQQARQPRIPMPDEQRLAALPPEILQRSGKIVWSRLSMGYQPRLTMAWFDCMRTFQSEAQLDRVFSNSFFWVITRANNCFY